MTTPNPSRTKLKITRHVIGLVALCGICLVNALRAENPTDLKEAVVNSAWTWDNPKDASWTEIRFTGDGLATIFRRDNGRPNVTRWQITSPHTITLEEVLNTNLKWFLAFDQTSENFAAIFSFNSKVSASGRRKTPLAEAVRPGGNANSGQVSTYKPDQSPIEVLKEQGPNVSAWVSSALDTPIPEAIWENLTFLKEALRDEAAQKPKASTAAYGFALRLCAMMIDDLAERKVAVTKAGGDAVLRQSSQLTGSRRDHLTWPMYALERDERGDRKQWAEKHTKELVDWAKRTNDMRYDLGVWYNKFREALRQSPPGK
jgi:hypothetical protein